MNKYSIDDFLELSPLMKSADRWLLWKSIPNKDPLKKNIKKPFYANGTARNGSLDSPEDRSNLVSFEDALKSFNSGNYTGLGFALGADGSGRYWQGIDFDKLSKHPNLGFLVDELPGYVEHSPSGDGVHAIGYGRKFESLGSNETGIEAYSSGRYFTVTGQCCSIGEPVCLADYVEKTLKPLHSVRKSTSSDNYTTEKIGSDTIRDLRSALLFMRADDRELWQKNGHRLKDLGDVGRGLWLEWSSTSDKYDPQADAKTWESFKPTHTGYRAIFKEAQGLGWVNPGRGSSSDDNEDDAQEWNDSLSSEIDYVIPFPCIARDIQLWIMETSQKVQPGLALASTLCTLATIYGRKKNIDGIKGNVMILGLAESGEGKDWPLKASFKILDSIGLGGHFNGSMASGAALFDAVFDHPNSLLAIDEIGHYFSGINSKTSNQFSREIMPMITEMYTSANDMYIEKKRKGTEAKRIIEPNLSLFGLSTERQIFESLRTNEVLDGSLARFMVIFGENNVTINQNRKTDTSVPDQIKSRLEEYSGKYFSTSAFKSTSIILSPEYSQAKLKLSDHFNQLGIEAGKQKNDKAIFKPFYYRMAVRSIQLAMLIDNCYSLEVLEWCANLVEKSTDVFIKKFCHLAADNDNEKYFKQIEAVIKEAGKYGVTKKGLLLKTRNINSMVKKQILADLLDSDRIFMTEGRENGSKKNVTRYFWRK